MSDFIYTESNKDFLVMKSGMYAKQFGKFWFERIGIFHAVYTKMIAIPLAIIAKHQRGYFTFLSYIPF